MKILAAQRMQASQCPDIEAVRALITIKEWLAKRAGTSVEEGGSENTLAIMTAQQHADALEPILLMLAQDDVSHSWLEGKAKGLLAKPQFVTEEMCAARDDYAPTTGDTIEFLGDQFTDKGPATGEVIKSFVTVDGPYITVKFSDSQETFSWDNLHPNATRPAPDHWEIQKTKTAAFTINLKKSLGQK